MTSSTDDDKPNARTHENEFGHLFFKEFKQADSDANISTTEEAGQGFDSHATGSSIEAKAE